MACIGAVNSFTLITTVPSLPQSGAEITTDSLSCSFHSSVSLSLFVSLLHLLSIRLRLLLSLAPPLSPSLPIRVIDLPRSFREDVTSLET